MARRRKHEEHTNHERWAIPYGDLVTLLLAFFVVMYSISSVNEGKYRVLSDSLMSAFHRPARSMEPIQIGDPAKKPTSSQIDFIKRPSVVENDTIIVRSPNQGEEQRGGSFPTLGALVGSDKVAEIGKIAEEVSHALRKLVDQGLVSVNFNELWLEVEIKDSILFPSGSAQLQTGAIPILKEVAAIFRDASNPVRVEGFTDNVPINTLLYPSNWELSTVRAASVVRLFAREGIAPERMSALGYGEYRPVAGNDTAEGRARNRRVVLVVLADEDLTFLRDSALRERGVPEQAPSRPDRREAVLPSEDAEPEVEKSGRQAENRPAETLPEIPGLMPAPSGPVMTGSTDLMPLRRPIAPIELDSPLTRGESDARR